MVMYSFASIDRWISGTFDAMWESSRPLLVGLILGIQWRWLARVLSHAFILSFHWSGWEAMISVQLLSQFIPPIADLCLIPKSHLQISVQAKGYYLERNHAEPIDAKKGNKLSIPVIKLCLTYLSFNKGRKRKKEELGWGKKKFLVILKELKPQNCPCICCC